MHPDHHSLPFLHPAPLFKFDGGQGVERACTGRDALTIRSAQTQPPRHDPLLLDLASAALRCPDSAVMAPVRGAWTAIDPSPGKGLAMIGLRCPPDTAAVAAAVQCQTRSPDGCRRGGVLAWSVDRRAASLALFREETSGNVELLSAVAGTLLDSALRALGLGTPPCPSPPVWFPDGVFLQRLARLLDRPSPRLRHSPSWESLSVLYPLNGGGEPLSPCLTRGLRQHFHESNTWTSLRQDVAGLPDSAPAILPGLTPEIAHWLDDGSFARWVLSRVSDVPSTLAWLCADVEQNLAHDLSLALGEVHEP